jgi:MFS transporter, DHA2 family, multidrug resistance protein
MSSELKSADPKRRGTKQRDPRIMGVVVAPILGPTLDGWMTDNMSWR